MSKYTLVRYGAVCFLLVALLTQGIVALARSAEPSAGYQPSGQGIGTAGIWHVEMVDGEGCVGGYPSLELDAAGRPRISYTYSTCQMDMHLKYATYDGTAWQLQIIDSTYRVGGYTSLELDSAGRSHISHYDSGTVSLKYNRYVGSGGNCGPNNEWQCVKVPDPYSHVGEASSLALDSADHPHISYYLHYGGVRYAYYNGSTWLIQMVDSAGNVGVDTSIDVDSANRPHIAYFDYTNRDLKYARYDGTAWQVQVVDSAGDVGSNAALVVDSAGRPHISYADRTNQDLKYAWYDGTTWQIEVVDSEGELGGAVSIVLDSDGHPHISYNAAGGLALKYAYYDGSAWHTELVDANPAAATSLVLDSLGEPHIAYYDHINFDLKYAWREQVPPTPIPTTTPLPTPLPTCPPSFPDDTRAPAGSIHAHDNMLWPPDNRMVTVTLDGHVIDELSIARDNGGIGISLAYIVVDGQTIVLKDGTTNLLGEDGSFSVTTQVRATKGAVYSVELYASDTEPPEQGGPNNGLVDSTYIRVPDKVGEQVR